MATFLMALSSLTLSVAPGTGNGDISHGFKQPTFSPASGTGMATFLMA